MASEKKQQLNRYVSPKGLASYPKINEEDVYEGKPVGYKVELKIEREEALKFFTKFQDTLDEFVDTTKKSLDSAKAKKLIVNDLMTENDDGTISVRFSSKNKPVVFDSKGKLIENPPAIWNGSILKVSFTESEPYYKSGKVGIKFYLNAVQVIELKTSGFIKGSNPFDVEDEGYTYEDAPEAKDEDDESPFDY